MFKKTILAAFLFTAALPLFAQDYAKSPFYTEAGLNELSFFGGVSVSKTQRDFDNKSVEYGGSGFTYGLTALTYLNRYLAAGFDFAYSDNGYGAAQDINGNRYRVSTAHYTPLILGKIHLLPRSPFTLYVPLGIGADIVRLGFDESGKEFTKNTQGGISFMAGLGAELETGNGTFFAIEGRYYYTDFMGTDSNGVTSLKYYNILFKTGMRFDASFLM